MLKNYRLLFVIVLITMIISAPLSVVASDEVRVYIDGVKLEFDVPPQIIDGRTMVPMRKIFESLGAAVSWDNVTQTATGQNADTIVNVSIGSKILFKNGNPKSLDVAPVLFNDRTLVPARAIAESFGCTVKWEEETKKVMITTDGLSTEKTKLTAMQISEKVSPSVFYIEVSDANRKPIASGSGFFVSSTGVAVTNYHVIEDTYYAQITTVNGDKHNVTDVIAYDKKLDIAIIRIDKQTESGKTVSGFPALELANSDNVKAGETVYALGSPKGLQNTISDGIVSNVKQLVDENYFIQITAPISRGSSGGALVNEFGEVLGITSAGIVADGAQNIGFAIPINILRSFDLNSKGVPYNQFASNTNQFILEVDTSSLSLVVGETKQVLVHAEGKGDWSVYWKTDKDNYISCEWGGWLKDKENVCKLYVTAKKSGKATVTVYTDNDPKGVDIVVNIKDGSSSDVYPDSYSNIPTYTTVTGLRPIDYKEYESSYMYAYRLDSLSTVQKYMRHLLTKGFQFYNQTEKDGIVSYYYVTKENEIFSVSIASRWNQVWIYIPRH